MTMIGDRKIRIAIVCGTMNIGGGETMSAKLAGYIDKNKYEVKYIVISHYIDNQIAERLHSDGTDFVCLDLPNSFSFKTYKVFSKAMKEFDPDVVHDHLFSAYSWVWAFLHNKPIIATMHGDPHRRKDNRVEMIMKAKALQGNLRIIGCSKKTMEQTIDCYGIKNKYMGYIYNPISIDKFNPHEPIDNPADFVAMGRLHEVKNYPLMLRAFKKVVECCPNAKLSIAGSGPLESELKALTEELGLQNQVTFLGNVQDVPTLLSKKSILLLSSLSEACPMVILEAMAAGLPIIATDVGGVSELVSDNGIIVKSGDVDGFADAMLKLVNDPVLLKKMSQKSLLYATKYDKSVVTLQYECEYEKLAKKGEPNELSY